MRKAQSKKTSVKVVGGTVAGKVSHASAQATSSVDAADIARRAFEIYEQEGRPDGRHLAHWVQAENELGLG